MPRKDILEVLGMTAQEWGALPPERVSPERGRLRAAALGLLSKKSGSDVLPDDFNPFSPAADGIEPDPLDVQFGARISALEAEVERLKKCMMETLIVRGGGDAL